MGGGGGGRGVGHRPEGGVANRIQFISACNGDWWGGGGEGAWGIDPKGELPTEYNLYLPVMGTGDR